jgi:excisionase family DNA binding protein
MNDDMYTSVMAPAELEQLARAIADRVADQLTMRRRLTTRHETAKILGVSVPTIDRMLRDNEIPFIAIRGKRLFDAAAVIAHLTKSTAEISP